MDDLPPEVIEDIAKMKKNVERVNDFLLVCSGLCLAVLLARILSDKGIKVLDVTIPLNRVWLLFVCLTVAHFFLAGYILRDEGSGSFTDTGYRKIAYFQIRHSPGVRVAAWSVAAPGRYSPDGAGGRSFSI
jgi:hypothetical protein